MPSKLNVPPAIQRRAVRRLDEIANDPNSPVHSATTAARTLLARAKTDDDDDGMPEDRPALLLLPTNDRDYAIDEAVRRRILAGELIATVPLYNSREPDYEAKNALLEAAASATLDRLYPVVGHDPHGVEALKARDDEKRRKARLRQRKARARRAAAA